MTQISCPHCQKNFSLDESERQDIIKQIRDDEFNNELEERLALINKYKENELALAQNKTEKTLAELQAEFDKKVMLLNAELDKKESEHQLALKNSLDKKEKELRELQFKLNNQANEHQFALKEVAANQIENINNLKNELERKKSDHQLALNNAVSEVERKLSLVEGEFKRSKLEHELSQASLVDTYKVQLAERDDAIIRLREMKVAMSTKIIGETLELHCENTFNKVRSYAFPNAYFEKDNDVVEGSKVDYVFRDYDNDGTEIVSIMFEMKNEMDTTATKKKNSDFFKALDKDRNAKGCEYAILVSMLESDNDLYNDGIVEVYQYPKMFVVRPQFFMQIISLLRGTSMKSVEYKRELELIR